MSESHEDSKQLLIVLQGWSSLAQGATKFASQASETVPNIVIKPPLAKAGTLCNDAVFLYVCVCLSPIKLVKSSARWQHMASRGGLPY